MGLDPNYLKGNGKGGPKLVLHEVLGPLPPGSMGFLHRASQLLSRHIEELFLISALSPRHYPKSCSHKNSSVLCLAVAEHCSLAILIIPRVIE